MFDFEQLRDCLPSDGQHSYRTEQLAALIAYGFPRRRDENYRYTPLTARVLRALEVPTSRAAESTASPISVSANHGCILGSLDGSTSAGGAFGRSPFEDAFVRLNSALFEGGLALAVPDHTQLKDPVQLSSIAAQAQDLVHRRLAIYLGTGSQLTLIQDQTLVGLENWVIEIHCAAQAQLCLIKLQDNQGTLIDHTYIAQEENSHCACYVLSSGGGMLRNNLQVSLQGANSTHELHGVLLALDQGHLDHHTHITHAHAQSHSYQNYRSALSGTSQGVFNGAIHICPDAQDTTAYQSSKTLLLSPQAQMHAKPQLEIEADQVRCSHGCTIGHLDSEALFYLQARGIVAADAQFLLTQAFVLEALASQEHSLPDSIADRLAQWLYKRLAHLPSVPHA